MHGIKKKKEQEMVETEDQWQCPSTSSSQGQSNPQQWTKEEPRWDQNGQNDTDVFKSYNEVDYDDECQEKAEYSSETSSASAHWH